MILFRSEDGKNKALGIGLVSSKTFWLMVISRKKKEKEMVWWACLLCYGFPKSIYTFKDTFDVIDSFSVREERQPFDILFLKGQVWKMQFYKIAC